MTSLQRTALHRWLDDVRDGRHAQAAPHDEGDGPHGMHWRQLAEGVLELTPADPRARRFDAMLSAGIHGDETAPIEILDRILRDIGDGTLVLRERVLVILGNPAAVRAGKRYLEYDLNRLFCGAHARRSESPATLRARELEALATRFFEDRPTAGGAPLRRHFDMHTAIRASHFRRFAVVPGSEGHPPPDAWIDALAAADIEAVMLTQAPSVTFSYFTRAMLGAESCTLELGKVEPFGQNRLADFAGIDQALRRWLAGGEMQARDDGRMLHAQRFRVAGEIVRQSDAFVMDVPDDTPNFTPYPAGTVLARDGEYTYTVSHPVERIVFPNPKVANGLRAGVMVVPA